MIQMRKRIGGVILGKDAIVTRAGKEDGKMGIRSESESAGSGLSG